MSAAAQRATLGAIGQDLTPEAGDRRATALLRSLHGGGAAEPPGCIVELASAPDWLRAPRDTQRELARAVALLAMAPTLATSIDGGWLGTLAERCGEDAIDWAIGHAEAANGAGERRLAPDMLEAAGFGLLRAALPAGLRGVLDWAPASAAPGDGAFATRLAAIAWERCRA